MISPDTAFEVLCTAWQCAKPDLVIGRLSASTDLTKGVQNAVMKIICGDATLNSADPLFVYRRRCLKQLLNLAEAQKQELDDELVEEYTQHIQSSSVRVWRGGGTLASVTC